MLTNITNTKICYTKTIVNKRGLRMRKLYRPFLTREAAARGVLEVSLCRRLRKTPTDSSSCPSEEGPLGAAAKVSFHSLILTPFNENR